MLGKPLCLIWRNLPHTLRQLPLAQPQRPVRVLSDGAVHGIQVRLFLRFPLPNEIQSRLDVLDGIGIGHFLAAHRPATQVLGGYSPLQPDTVEVGQIDILFRL